MNFMQVYIILKVKIHYPSWTCLQLKCPEVVALAIQQRPFLEKPATHALSTIFFGGKKKERIRRSKSKRTCNCCIR
ncbi:hypothetical protein GLOIN_2v1496162 [Rhizophagus clarus]|uniref:Uncharacterized protein n=1 Tax=Rhizophagus clarus TaxID=94130 RepID=A0A8H3L5W0_9GLOM|nr:hypothetical protein GLOIN_2v1496162 [Rhizophagus clarus]